MSAAGLPEHRSSGRLTALDDFGTNPGALQAWCYVPTNAEPRPALVVVLHGCTQNASDYDRSAGWTQLADELGFAVLLPEQRRTNNANLCFNWYEQAHCHRDAGEPLSIRQMIATMIERHGLDPARVFINGLSAGGAMTSVMLATYPEVFAGGAIIAGLPFGTASGVGEALSRMRGQPTASPAKLAASVRRASAHDGPWPRVSVWHGAADHVVDPSNADAVLAQWLAIHAAAATPIETLPVDGQTRRLWRNANGEPVVEDFRIGGLGHGTPLSTVGDDACGTRGPHMLEAGISSTRHIARFWGLEPPRATREGKRKAAPAAPTAPKAAPIALPSTAPAASRGPLPSHAKSPAGATGVGKVIEDALRSAGLMR